MKKRIISIAIILLLSLLWILPASTKVNAAEAWMQQEAQLDHVTDAAGLLTQEEVQDLELKAEALAETYGFGVYIITVEDYQDYTDGDTHDASTALYKGYSLGIGEGKDGLLLLLSMADRDLNLYTYGEYGHYAFGDAAREQMLQFYLDDFGEDEWYNGFSDYLEWAGKYLEQADAGTPLF